MSVDIDPAAPLMWEHGIWGQEIAPDFEFLKGKKYLRLDGKVVTIIRGRSGSKGYETVQGDDGAEMVKPYQIWNQAKGRVEWTVSQPEELGFRYNRTTTQGCLGRCTGSTWKNSHNLIPIYFPYLNGEA